jgi:hypothetical protein
MTLTVMNSADSRRRPRGQPAAAPRAGGFPAATAVGRVSPAQAKWEVVAGAG